MGTEQKQSGDHPKNTKKNLLIAFLVLLLAAVIGFGVWYWQQQTIEARNSRISSLENQVERLTAEEEQPETTDEEQTEEADKQTVYQAEVGKFTLTLPDEYKVVQRNDGGGEGGPSTQILLAEETDEPGVYTSSIWDKLEISAIPLQTVSFRDRVEGRLRNANVIEESTATIDGVEAEVYKVGGLGTSKKIFFTNNNIFYHIDMGSNTEAANERLETVKNGFQFDD